MLFQWYLFAFLFILYVIAAAGDQTYKIHIAGEYEVRYKRFTVLATVAVLTYVAATRPTNFIDTKSYYSHYMREPGTLDSVIRNITGTGKDKSFYTVTAILKGILGQRYQLYFAAISGVSLMLVFSVYRKYSCNFFITVFLFIASGEYVQWTHNGIRQFVAVAIAFSATDLLLQRRYVLYSLIILLASTFHGSALMMIPAMFVLLGPAWNRKVILTVLVVLVLASSSSLLNSLLLGVMENTQYADDVDALMATGGTNAFRVLVFAIPPILALLFREPIAQMNIPWINLAVNMSVLSLCVYVISMFTSGIYIGRLPIYFSLHNYVLLPWLINRFFEKKSGKFVYLMLIAGYMGFYYYQMHVVWSIVTAL